MMTAHGFYWVRFVEDWEVAEWNGTHWLRCGLRSHGYRPDEIGERLIPPGGKQ